MGERSGGKAILNLMKFTRLNDDSCKSNLLQLLELFAKLI